MSTNSISSPDQKKHIELNGEMANKAWLPTGCPLRVESVMTVQPLIQKSERALRQPVAAL
jgi:hypothetical protein